MNLSVLGHRRLATGVFLSYDRRYLIDQDRSFARDVVRHPGGIAILPVDGARVWLVSQYRTAAGRRLLEVPAGKLDPQERDLEAAARRELAEEIGANAAEWRHLTKMLPSPGYTDETIDIFAATGLEFGERRPDGAEERGMEVVTVALDEAVDSIDRGEITDAKTQIAILLWARQRSHQ
ncbi:MAG TPA: NUDIX hydrolase [Acidimicrobiia bacterium]|nr:NUDIX hydrolase [Acidimicrobiia bacterium]